MGAVAAEGEISEENGIGGKVEAVAVSLSGKYGGSVEGKMTTFSADAEAKANILTGGAGKYGFEGKAAAQASAIAAEGKACLGSKESFAMICGKIGANAGPAFDAGGKVIWDNNKEKLELGAQGKIIAGAEIEGQINWKKVKEIFK